MQLYVDQGMPRSDFSCKLCNVTCNSMQTLQQHLASKRHIMRAAQAASAPAMAAAQQLNLAPIQTHGCDSPGSPGSSPSGRGGGITYVGPNATLRDYCYQEISPDLNASVAALLTQVKGFQDRAMARNPQKVRKGAGGWGVGV
jgi:hypothetical protein